MTADGRFKPANELRPLILTTTGETPVDRVITYCGSGVTAAQNVLAFEVAGLGRPRLYAGSWSEWSSDPERPVEAGGR